MPIFRGSGSLDDAESVQSLVEQAAASAVAAAASETGAAASETAAETAETNAETAETAAEAAQSYAEEWANKAEDSLVSAAAGGDLVDDYSAKHFANKAAASATAIMGRNLIINGSFDVAQRGTTFSTVGDGDYTLDRWVYNKTGAVVHDISQSTDGTTNEHYITVSAATADASIAAGDLALIEQKIEGYTAAYLRIGTSTAKEVTLSFRHAHEVTGTYCVAFRNSALNRSYVAEYTQSSADTWETAEITLTLDTAGTWVLDEGVGLSVCFTIAAGTTFQTAADTWTAGNYIATSNQVNGMGSTDDKFRIRIVKLEVGPAATAFSTAGANFAEELTMCQRYYEKSYDCTTTPGTYTTTGADRVKQAATATFASLIGMSQFVVRKRTAPTTRIWAANASASSGPGYVWNYITSGEQPAIVLPSGETKAAIFSDTPDATHQLLDGHSAFWNWDADAEL